MKLNELILFSPEEKFQIEEKRRRNTDTETESFNLVVAATFTAEPITAYISWWCKQFGEDVAVQFAPYNQIFQQLLEPSSLLATNTGMNLLLIRFEDWVRDDNSPEELQCQNLEKSFLELTAALSRITGATPYLAGQFPVARHLVSRVIMAKLTELNQRWHDFITGRKHMLRVDFTELAVSYNIPVIFDEVKDRIGHLPFGDEFYAAMGTKIARTLISWKKQRFKAIVMDCDNTLWQGICGEDGPFKVSVNGPYRELQQMMLRKYQEGFLLMLCSKNNEPDVWEVFEKNPEMVLKKEQITAWRINWKAKSHNLRELAAEINIGVDSLIFIDDSPLECAEVRLNRPEVLTLQLPVEPQIPGFLKHVWAFDRLKVTAEDRQRAEMYSAERKRKAVREETPALNDFLKGLAIKVSFREMEAGQVIRVAQLTQRTNQFNLSTIRRTETELNELLLKPGVKCQVVEVNDRFGEYGLVGVVITRIDTTKLSIDTFLLSCRVLGRRVEDAVLLGLKRYCQGHKLGWIEAVFYPTDKNKPFEDFLRLTRWEPVEVTSQYTKYQLPVSEIPDNIDFIDFNDRKTVVNDSLQKIAQKPESVINAGGERSEAEPDVIVLDSAPLNDWEAPDTDWESLPHHDYLLALQNFNGKKLLELPVRVSMETGMVRKDYVAPRNETETKLVEIWEKILEVEQVGIDDDFFGLGGNSLVAIKLEVEMEKCNLQFNGLEVFQYKTVRQIGSLFVKPPQEQEQPDLTSRGDSNDGASLKQQEADNKNTAKVIDHIEPFNDVFYKNCFYNSAFPVARYFKKSVIPFLINDVITYTYDPAGSGLKLNTDYLSCQTMPELLKTVGITVAAQVSGDDIVGRIRQSIAAERPVIIWVDCFYESIRKDMYQKKHWPHTWLVYGYDAQNQVCNIIEHRHKDNLTYEKRVISYADVENSHTGYLNHFRQSPEEVVFYEFSADPDFSEHSTDPAGYRGRFLANLLEKREQVQQSIQYLDLFQTEYSRIIANQDLLDSALDDIIAGLNDIINSKQVERYKIEQIFGRDFEGYPLLLEIINHWTSIRTILVKYLYSKVYKPDFFLESTGGLKQVPILEYRYLDLLTPGPLAPGAGMLESVKEVVELGPEAAINTVVEYAAPTQEMEKRLVDIWQEILEIERIGIHDNFFDLGGNSIKVIPIIEKAKEHGLELSINDIFSGKTIANICANICQSSKTDSAAEATQEQSEPAQKNRNPLFHSLKESRQYEVDENGVKTLPIKFHNEITSYLHYYLPLTVILADERLLPWYYEHFIDIFAGMGENGWLKINYLEYFSSHNQFMISAKLGYDLLHGVPDIIHYLNDKINRGFYAIVNLDEYYLPVKEWYQKQNFVHPSLIYGYHDTDHHLMAIGFNQDHILAKFTINYDQFTEAYENGKVHYREMAPWAEENAVELLKFKAHQTEYPFNLQRFLTKLDSYLSSTRDDSIVYHFLMRNENIAYGAAVYDEVVRHLENILKNQITMDYTTIHFLAEHKKGIINRLRYIGSRYRIPGDLLKMIEEYNSIVEQFEAIRIRFLEFRYVIDSIENMQNVVKKTIPIIQSIQKNEHIILRDISGRLAQIVTEMNEF